MLNTYRFKTDLRLLIDNAIVAKSEEEARNRLKEFFQVVIEEGSIVEFSTSKKEVSTLESVENVPANFSTSHHVLIEMGYPIEKIKGYSEEDAEEEIHAAMSLGK